MVPPNPRAHADHLIAEQCVYEVVSKNGDAAQAADPVKDRTAGRAGAL